MLNPIAFITNLLANLFTICLISGSIYYFREYNKIQDYNQDQAYQILLLAIFLGTLVVFGRFYLYLLFQLFKLFKPTIAKNQYKIAPTHTRSPDFEDYILSDDSKLHVEFYGPVDSSIKLVLIHGLGVDLTQWYYFKENLANDYRLIMIDLIGYGKSHSSSNREFKLSEYSEDLKFLLAKINTSKTEQKFKTVLFGHSMGGMVILNFLKQFGTETSGMIDGLILSNTTYTDPTSTAIFGRFMVGLEGWFLKPLAVFNSLLSPLVRALNGLSYLNGSSHLSVALTGFAGYETWKQLDFATQYTYLESNHTIYKNYLDLTSYEVSEMLTKIKTPTLVISSKHDITTLPKASHNLAQKIPQAQIVVTSNSAHMMILENPEEAIYATKHFLNQLKS